MPNAKNKRSRYRAATDLTLARAFLRAARLFEKEPCLLATEHDAGFILHPYVRGEPRTGVQVFVKVSRFDESLLRSEPMSGGLGVNRRGAKLTGC